MNNSPNLIFDIKNRIIYCKNFDIINGLYVNIKRKEGVLLI